MEEQCSPLSWSHFYQEECVDELKHSLLHSTWELEAAVISAHEEISRKEDEILRLKDLLAQIIKERDEFKAQCLKLTLENKQLLEIHHTHPSMKNLSSDDDENNIDFSLQSSRSTESDNNNGNNIIVAVSSSDKTVNSTSLADDESHYFDRILRTTKKPLPENGKLLQAVMEAGPLLQTLLLAGPLPQWQHPPPQLSSSEIPPVAISSFASSPTTPNNNIGFKRATHHVVMNSTEVISGSSPPNKYQKVVHQSSLTQHN